MKMTTECIFCTIKQMNKTYAQFEKDPAKQAQFLKGVCREIAQAEEKVSPPELNGRIMNAIAKEAGVVDMYKQEKHEYNEAIMEMEDVIYEDIQSADDKLYRALQYSMTGNYIDFGVETRVTREKLTELIEAASKLDLGSTYEKLRKNLDNAKTLAFLLDNCGEIVFDKMCIAEIKELYPNLDITAVVRGMPIYNDVTIADADETGLSKIVKVTDNGMAMPGTIIDKIKPETRKLIEESDLVIAKGMGNFETMIGCGLNVYYIFLCKCQRFEREFGLPQYSGVLVNELDY